MHTHDLHVYIQSCTHTQAQVQDLQGLLSSSQTCEQSHREAITGLECRISQITNALENEKGLRIEAESLAGKYREDGARAVVVKENEKVAAQRAYESQVLSNIYIQIYIYIYIYMCLYICMYIYIYIYIYISSCMDGLRSMSTQIPNEYTYACIYVCICMYDPYVCIYVYTYDLYLFYVCMMCMYELYVCICDLYL